ncbi:MAG: YceI family protein [Caldilineaceae bacterium]|nr:YceI family protein [Caldilineaceae bacterium]
MHYTISKFLLLFLLSILVAACGAPAASPAPAAAAEPTATPVPVEAAAEPAAMAESAGEAVSGQHTYVIVPEESKASYLVDEEFFAGALSKLGIGAGPADVVGSTQAIEGQLQLNLDDLSAALGENTFTVKLNTLQTNRDDRDKWIRENGPRFNDFPLATFTASAIEGTPATYTEGEEVSFKLAGDLTIRDVTNPVTFDVTARLLGDTLTGVATTQLLMSDFGIEPPNFANTLTVADEFGIEVQFTARKQAG